MLKVRDEKGFTLIELLIVIAIIAILAAIAIPQFADYRMRAVEASMATDAKNAATAVEATYSDAQTYAALAVGNAAGVSTWTIGAFTSVSRYSTNNVLSVNASTATTYSICVNNPNARPARLFVAVNQTGGLGWAATCAAAVAAIP
jgi:prepilin-type N-terminal cleavage/methylation domain-containing protein